MTTNAKILDDRKCISCGWPIVSVLCNDEMGRTPPYSHDDYWYYCSNKTCNYHEGEGHSFGFKFPNFIVDD